MPGWDHMNRLHCTNMDVVCMVLQVVSTAVMATLYAVYARQNQKALANVRESNFRKHLVDLRNVFVVCGSIHVLNCIIGWFFSLNYTIVLVTLVNSWQSWRLVKSKALVLSIQKHVHDQVMAEQVDDALELVSRVDRDDADAIRRTLVKLESVLRNSE